MIVSSQSGTYAFDVKTGKQIWQSPLGAFNTPAVQGDQIVVSYTANRWGTVALLDAATGSQTWTKQLLNDVNMSDPVLDQGIIYVSATDQHSSIIFAIKVKGEVVWQQTYPGIAFGNVMIRDGNLYAILSDPHYHPWQLLQIDKATGKEQSIRTFDPLTYPNASYPLITDSVTYLGADNGIITALNNADWSILWTKQLPRERDEISSMSIDGSTLYVATGRTVFALNTANGHTNWSSTVPGSSDRSHQLYQPSVVHHMLYLYAPNDTIVYALDPDNGDVRWHYDKVGYATSSPMVSGGITYLPGNTNVSLVQESDGAAIKQLGTQIWDASQPALIAMPS
jgi:outer membrane protein assembly factor BamB